MATIAARRPRLKSLRVCGCDTVTAPYRVEPTRTSVRSRRRRSAHVCAADLAERYRVPITSLKVEAEERRREV